MAKMDKKHRAFLLVAAMIITGMIPLAGCRHGESGETTSQPASPVTVVNPFTGRGELTTQPRMLLGFSIDNLGKARPQTGLESADLVFELPVEGGVTRFLALFYSDIPEELTSIGPIRSVRPYFIDLAGEYGAVLVHCGGSPEALRILSDSQARHIDQIASPSGFFRSPDRRPPHNLYGDLALLRQEAGRFAAVDPAQISMPWSWSGGGTDLLDGGGSVAEQVEISYWAGYKVMYRYQADTREYVRYINQAKHETTAGPVTVDHVIVQFSDARTLDEKGRLEVGVDSGGRLLVFSAGHVAEGTWEWENGRTVYWTDGGRLSLLPGKAWIHLVPAGRKITW